MRMGLFVFFPGGSASAEELNPLEIVQDPVVVLCVVN